MTLSPPLRRALLFTTVFVTFGLGASPAPAASTSAAGGDRSPSYIGPDGTHRGVPRLRVQLIGHPGARSLARSGALPIRVSSDLGAFVIVRSSIRGIGGRHVRGLRSPKPLGVALVRPGSQTRIIRLPARLRASLRSAKRVAISLRAAGQSAFGVTGRVTLRRRLGR